MADNSEEEEEDQFIVSDGHLSVEDISMDGSEQEKIAELERRRQQQRDQDASKETKTHMETTYVFARTSSGET